MKMQTIAVYSYDTEDKHGDGQHLMMIWNTRNFKKLLKMVYERKSYFGIPKQMNFDTFYQLYIDGGFENVNKHMEYGSIDMIDCNEWING